MVHLPFINMEVNNRGINSPRTRRSSRRGASMMLKLLQHCLLVAGLLTFTTSFSTADDSVDVVPSTGVLCVSNCPTCPAVCSSTSPPPPPSTTYIAAARAPPPPAASYYSWGPPTAFCPPPPSYPTNNERAPNLQVSTPPTMETRGEYTYPYYYFYASQAAHHRPVPYFPASLINIVIAVSLFLCLNNLVLVN